jgi:hypothetical protein
MGLPPTLGSRGTVLSPDFGKELKAIREEAERKGWRVFRGKRYWHLYCPCTKKHKKNMAISPSDPNYVKNLLGQLGRATCWKG